MKQGRRELNKQQCRDRILKMSRRLFTSQGYELTTLEDIAAAAEISRGTLYNYFPSKETLLLGIAEAALDEVRQLVREDLVDEPSSLEKLRRAIEALVLDSIRYIALTRRIFYLNAAPENRLHVTRMELMELLEQLVREAQSQGSLRRDLPPEQVTEAFFGVYLLTQFGWDEIETYSEKECRDRVRRAMDRVLEGLAAKGAD